MSTNTYCLLLAACIITTNESMLVTLQEQLSELKPSLIQSIWKTVKMVLEPSDVEWYKNFLNGDAN